MATLRCDLLRLLIIAALMCCAVLCCRVLAPNKTIEIRLDKLDDTYGSPGLEDIERFSRALAQVSSRLKQWPS